MKTTERMNWYRYLSARMMLGAFIGVLLTGPAHALGVGVYAMSGSGSAKIKNGFSTRVDVDQQAFGLAFDTAVSDDKLFNYRFGLESGTIEYEGLELDEIAVTNDFGFAIVRNRAMRLWGGPQLRISFQDGSLGDTDWVGVGFGLGLSLGLNVHLGERMSLFAKATHTSAYYALNADSGSFDQDYDVDHTGTLFNLGLMVRFKDSF